MRKTIAVVIISALCLCMGVAHAEVREFLKSEYKQERAERKARFKLENVQKEFDERVKAASEGKYRDEWAEHRAENAEYRAASAEAKAESAKSMAEEVRTELDALKEEVRAELDDLKKAVYASVAGMALLALISVAVCRKGGR